MVRKNFIYCSTNSGGGGGDGGTINLDGGTLPELVVSAHSTYWEAWYKRNSAPYLIWGSNAGANVGGMFGSMSVSGTRKYWQNMTMGGGGFGQVGGGGIDWSGVANASLGFLGGAIEMFFGGAGEYFSAGTATAVSAPLITDGGVRFLSNGARLVFYFTGHNQTGNIIPGNAGAWIGKGVDMASGKSFYNFGYGQAFGGLTNDFGSFIITGGSGESLYDIVETPTLGNWGKYIIINGGYNNSMFYDMYPLKKK